MKRLLLAATLLAAPMFSACAATPGTQQQLVDSSTLALESMMGAADSTQIQSVLRKARAVVVCPNIFRAGFFVGGVGGGCGMLVGSAGGSWSNPAFFWLGSGSFGFQVGVQSAQVLMMVMTSGGLNALINSQFKFGADAGLTVATIGANANGSMSTALDADIITLSKTQGLYGGISLSGSVLANDSGAEQSYYGRMLDAREIVLGMEGANPGASPLRETLARYGG